MPAKTKRRTPPKRTRRVTNPFDDRLEVRMYGAEKQKLIAEAESRGMSASDLVRFQLGDLIAVDPPKPPQTPTAVPKALPDPPEDLTRAIAEGLGIRVGEAMLKIRLGKVTVAGEPWPHEEIPADLLPQVHVDGEPLSVQAPDQR